MKIHRNFKRWLQLADLHCGHKVGLTPPEFQDGENDKWGMVQRTCWKFYEEMVEKYKPYDVVHVNGDWIHGDNGKQGGTQLITTDRLEQGEIGAKAVIKTDCDKIRSTYGTPYHTGVQEDFEKVINVYLLAAGIDAKISGHGFYTFNGKNFNVKHKASSSTVHHGRLTPIAKQIDDNRWWWMKGVQPKADVLIRSHTHYYEQAGHDGCIGFSTPSLQGLGDKYGVRQCSGVVDFGLIVIDVYDDGRIIWKEEIMEGRCQADAIESL